jgi:hypothetical protein
VIAEAKATGVEACWMLGDLVPIWHDPDPVE